MGTIPDPAPLDGGDAAGETTGADGEVDAGEKRVFVTSSLFTGNLGGASGADAKCNDAARAAGLSGTYMAWISVRSNSGLTAAQRLAHFAGAYVLVDGTQVARGWSDLTSGAPLLHAIDATEDGGAPPIGTGCTSGGAGVVGSAVAPVWTNTGPSGELSHPFFDCDAWGSGAQGAAAWGDGSRTDLGWTEACADHEPSGPSPCGETAALYCFEQ